MKPPDRPARILLALESDPLRWRSDDEAIRRAVRIARGRDATLILLNVGSWRDRRLRRLPTGDREDRSRLRFLAGRWTCQQALAAEITDRHGIAVEVTARWGPDRRRAVLETATAQGADLVIDQEEPPVQQNQRLHN